jgi:predicted ATPase
MIDEIRVEKFKTIAEYKFQLSNLNLFTGLNGMGKSTLFQTLLLIRQSFLANSTNYTGEILLNGDLIRLGYGKDIFSQFSTGEKIVVFQVTDNSQKGTWELHWAKQDIDPDKSDIIKGHLVKTDHFFKSNLFTDNFVYLSAERIGPQLSYKIGSFDRVRRRRLGNKGDYALQYLSLVSKNDLAIPQLKHDQSKTINILDNVNAWLGEISPGVKIKITPNTDIEAIQLVIQFDAGPDNVITNEFRPINVGFGLTYVLSIIISILTAKSGDILILENPEAHLHPRGQSKIGNLVSLAAEHGVQLFVETHSDHILNGIRLSVKNRQIKNDKIEIFYFDRPRAEPDHKSKIYNIKILDSAKLTEFPNGFFDEWNNALFQLVNVRNEGNSK